MLIQQHKIRVRCAGENNNICIALIVLHSRSRSFLVIITCGRDGKHVFGKPKSKISLGRSTHIWILINYGVGEWTPFM